MKTIALKSIILFLSAILLFVFASKAQYIQFVENRGQWDARVNYAGQINGGGFFIEKNGYRVLLNSSSDWQKIADYYGGHHDSATLAVLKSNGKSWQTQNATKAVANNNANSNLVLHSHAYEVTFVNAATSPETAPDKALDTYNNYFIGNDKSKWATGCKIYGAVVYKNMYPNIDVRYYTANSQLKYDIIVHPGGDVSQIAMRFDGTNGLRVKKGDLLVSTSLGDVTELSPESYQTSITAKTNVNVSYAVSGNTVRFKADNYDKNTTLIIDPQIVFCSFTGSTADNWGYTATYDGQGNFYAGGIVFNNGFPTTLGAYSRTFTPGSYGLEGTEPIDVGIVKFNKTGSKLLFGTYLGGYGDEQPHSLIVDADGNLIISGRTSSKNYPSTVPKYGPDNNAADIDIFLTKLNSSGGLVASRRFGGNNNDGVNIQPKDKQGVAAVSIRQNYGDDARSEVIVDGSRNIYLASCTQSGDYPVTDNAFEKNFNNGSTTGSQDGVIIKTSPDLKTVFLSSYLGGSANDAAFVLALNPTDNNIYTAGATESNNMPGIAASSATFKNYNGASDGFVSVIDNNTYQLIKTSYFGTPGIDLIYGIQFDKFSFPYIMGTTTGSWPVINAAWSQAGGKQFIAKLKTDLSDWVYSTTFGKGSTIPDISPDAFLVDRCENVYVSGWSGGINELYQPGQSSIGLYVSPSAPAQFRSTDGKDFYFFVLERNAASPLYAQFFGQKGGFGDHVDGGTSRFDRQGIIYQAVCANCEFKQNPPQSRFPTTLGVVAPNNGATMDAYCNEAAVKIAFQLAGIGNGVRASILGREYDTTGCVPVTVNFIDTIALGKQYVWNFGDGTADVTTLIDSVSHTYTQIGDYRVRLISIDSSACNIADTSYTTIRVRKDKANLGFTSAKLPPCTSLAFQFTNTSTAPANKPFTNSSFVWDFGDGTFDTTIQPQPHTYAAQGTYIVKLSLIDSNYCNAPDELVDTIRIAANVKAQFTTPPAGCAPYTATFNNTSLAGQTFLWNFGDGATSTDDSPTHLYNTPGTYNVSLKATDSATCNKEDSTSLTIVVSDKPTASFTYSPLVAQNNTPTSFFNTSTGATSYKWLWGDGTQLATSNSDSVLQHMYNVTDTFLVTLIAYNQYGCTDTVTHVVASLVTPLVDVPNAIAPTGVNRTINVKGYGIAKMDWRIYNRWGTMIFVSTSQKFGWDGTYKGVLQPQEVYTYVLNVEFTDGKKYSKTGDITLLR